MLVLSDIENPLDVKEIYGWAKVFVSIGHDFIFLYRKEKAILDAFEEKNPNIFITHNDLLNRASIKAINNNQNCIPIIFINKDDEKNLKINNKKAIFICKEEKQDCLIIKPSCDIYSCLNPTLEKHMISDLCYVGKYCDDKILNKFFIDFNIKFWGSTKWPYSTYLGKIKDEEIKNAIFSSKFLYYSNNLNNEKWILYSYMCNKPVLIFQSNNLKFYLKDHSLFFENEEELFEKAIQIKKHAIDLKSNILSNKSHIKNNHLSHHRVSAILDYAGLKEESKKCQKSLEQILEKY